MTIREDLSEIKEHIAVLNDDYSKLVERIKGIETDVEWIKKLQWLILGAIMAAVTLTVAHIWFSKP